MGMVIDNDENEAWTEANDIMTPSCLNELFYLESQSVIISIIINSKTDLYLKLLSGLILKNINVSPSAN